MTPVWAGTAPLDSSIRGLLTSGSLLSWLREAAAVSSVPVSHTRLTTTGVDELAWAARSCNGFVRAGKKDKRKKRELMWQVTHVFAVPGNKKTPQSNATPGHGLNCSVQIHFVKPTAILALSKFTKLGNCSLSKENFILSIHCQTRHCQLSIILQMRRTNPLLKLQHASWRGSPHTTYN